jgi:phosphate transport system ATP-binding protein
VNGITDKNEIEERVVTTIEQVALWDEVKDKLKKSAFESGEATTTSLYRTCFGNKPSILLMDEPTSALDPISTSKIEELIYELKNKYTIVIVTHNMQQAGRVSDTTAFYMGELIEYDKTNQYSPNRQKNKQKIT